MVSFGIETEHHLDIVGVVEGIFISSEDVAGVIVISSRPFLQLIKARSCGVGSEDSRTDAVRNVHRPAHPVAVHPSVGEIGGEIELLDRTDHKLRGVGEVELLVVVLVLAHREDNLTTVGDVVVTTDDKRVVVKSCSVRVEKREGRRAVTKIPEHILNVTHSDP